MNKSDIEHIELYTRLMYIFQIISLVCLVSASMCSMVSVFSGGNASLGIVINCLLLLALAPCPAFYLLLLSRSIISKNMIRKSISILESNKEVLEDMNIHYRYSDGLISLNIIEIYSNIPV
jgi:hypothetical protein